MCSIKRLWVIEHLFYAFVCIDFLNSIEFLIVCLLISLQSLFLCEPCVLIDLQGNWLWCLISSYLIPVIIDFIYLGKIKWFAGFPQLPSRKVCYFRSCRKLFPERFGVSAHGESYFPNSFGACGLPAKVWGKREATMLWNAGWWDVNSFKLIILACCYFIQNKIE